MPSKPPAMGHRKVQSSGRTLTGSIGGGTVVICNGDRNAVIIIRDRIAVDSNYGLNSAVLSDHES